MIVGSGKYKYEVVENWAKLPASWSFVDVVGIAIDSKDNVYVFNRSNHPMMVFDHDGNFLESWGEGIFSEPHSVRIDKNDFVFCVDYGDHTVRKLTTDGEVLLTIGTKNKPSDTGAINRNPKTVKRAAGPFNAPTDVAFGPLGEIYVSDGYGNARIHKFSKDGELLFSWGEPGDKAGQFCLPHSIWVDKQGKVYVADRENSRIQIFTLDGEFITQWDANRPTSIYVDREGVMYISELGYLTRPWPWVVTPENRELIPRVTVRSLNGEILTKWGGEDRCAKGNFFAPHTICVDSRGDIYVGEVVTASKAPVGCHALQKFVRKR